MDHQTGKRCALHKPGEHDVDPKILDSNNIWTGRNMRTVSARNAFVPFLKVPFKDRVQLSVDSEERLIYCGSCFKNLSKDPLTSTLQYEQDNRTKVWARSLLCLKILAEHLYRFVSSNSGIRPKPISSYWERASRETIRVTCILGY